DIDGQPHFGALKHSKTSASQSTQFGCSLSKFYALMPGRQMQGTIADKRPRLRFLAMHSAPEFCEATPSKSRGCRECRIGVKFMLECWNPP
ncbi:hypothetical protein, partial [Bradyrhizobium sp. SZCCHNS3016]|uniref:hypothetical protein n=1 Tax=Bradyrhizobium sp. SZCCHNS3016 TaxID=3057318 RepID=UPI002915F344